MEAVVTKLSEVKNYAADATEKQSMQAILGEENRLLLNGRSKEDIVDYQSTDSENVLVKNY